MKEPKKQEERLAQFRKIAALQKDPACMEKLTKAVDTMERQADTLLPQIASAKAVVTKSEQGLASVRTRSRGAVSRRQGGARVDSSR